jgi:hypothetical protein
VTGSAKFAKYLTNLQMEAAMNFGLDIPLGLRHPMSFHAKACTLCSSLFAILLLVLALSMPRVSPAQGITGSITGTATDQTGAAVTGATVTAIEVGTNGTHTVTTSDIGSYTISNLPPGQYTVIVSKGNFKNFKQTNITLQIDQVVQLDVALTVGSTGETVEVTGAPPVLQTEDSSVGQVIDSEAIQSMPLNGRLSLMGLIAQAPGIQGVGPQDQLATRGVTFSAGTGGRNAYGGLGSTLDGVTNAEITLQRAEPEVPSLDAISEFKVISTGSPAEFGQPTQVIVVSASGTNKFHGELLEYNRSKGTQAKYYFSPGPRPTYERNEFGGNFAGPIVIPHLYNGKDHSFFFAAYEGFRLQQSVSRSTTQPSAAMRGGDFSGLGITIVNPATGLPFNGNQFTNINPVSQALMAKLLPCADVTTFTAGNCNELVSYTQASDRISVHIDQKLGPNDQIRGTFLHASYGPNPTPGTDSLQGGVSNDGEKNTNIILGWAHTFSPSMVLDSNGSFFHLPIYRAPQNVGTKWESIIPGLSPQTIEGAPHLKFSDGITRTGEFGSHDLEQSGQINTSLTKILSKHTLKAGFSYLYDNHGSGGATAPEHGQFNFTGQYSGEAFADFLLGYPGQTQQGTPSGVITRNISSQWAGYLQDDWKPMRKLTVNIGVRYDLQWFSNGPYNDASLFVPSLGKVVVFGSSYTGTTFPIIPYDQKLLSDAGLLTLSSEANISNNPYSYIGRPAKDIAPRLGFAYQIASNTVLRGAYGIYFNLLPASYVSQIGAGSTPFFDSEAFTNSLTGATAFTMSNPFSGTRAYGGNTAVNAEHSLETPYTEQYNLALEHQFKGQVAVRVGYVGQHNLKQNNFDGNGNIIPYLNLSDPIDPTQPLTAKVNSPIPLLGPVPYPMSPIFHTIMNSLQIGAHKEFRHGLGFGAEYQWSRVLGTESIEDFTGRHPNDSKGPIAGLTPQVLQVNYSYAFPIGKGKALFGSAGPVANTILGGWQLSGLVNAQTGQPFNPTFDPGVSPVDFSSAPALPGAADLSSLANYDIAPRPNRVAGVPLYPRNKSKNNWFNPAAFACPLVTDPSNGNSYCFGNGTSGYDMLRGPAYQDWDMSLRKDTKWEHYDVQLRADAFNVFNHPSFSVPNADITAPGAGTVTGTPDRGSPPAYEPRTIEFGAKFNF